MTTLLKIVPELRNQIINGNLDFWQRGTSIVPSGSAFLADRFRLLFDSPFVSQYTLARSTDVPTVAQSGFQSRYSLSVSKGASIPGGQNSSSYSFISYKMEGQDYQALHGAKKVRLQFWVKSTMTGTYSIALANSDESRSFAKDYTIPIASTWQRVTMDLTTDDAGTWLFDNGVGLNIMFALVTGSDRAVSPDSWQSISNRYGSTNQVNFAGTAEAHTFQIAQVALYPIQASSGITLPFNRAGRNIQDELSMCQRYYEKSYDVDVAPGTNTASGAIYQFGSTDNNSNIGATLEFKTTKRATPSLLFYQTDGTPGVWAYGRNGGSGAAAPSTLIGSSGGLVYLNAGGPWVVAYVNGHFIADAEL